MAGSEETTGPANEGKPSEHKHKVKTFSCTHCGASISLRNPESLSAACDSCHSLIDTSDENYRILQVYMGKTLFSPVIKLGSRGELFGHTWEMIGYIARQEESSSYFWEEYLLFNPYQGYRWLTCASGHWNFVRGIKEKPDTISAGNSARYKGKQFRLFDRGPASNLFVVGEFYWKVKQSYNVLLEDYVCPPEMLSCETDQHEINWSLAAYVEAGVVSKAFNLEPQALPCPSGIAPNQPCRSGELFNKSFPWWMLFAVLLTALQIGHLCTCNNHLSFNSGYPFIPNSKSTTSTTTEVFTLDKAQANVNITVTAPVDNSWFYLSGELVNNETGMTYSFDRSVEYYHGYDSDGAWTEGSVSNDLIIPSVPAGKYYIDFDYESGGFSAAAPASDIETGSAPDARYFKLAVWRDTPTYTNYLWCLLFVSAIPVIWWIMKNSDETRRWSNSDFTPYKSSG